MSTKNPDVIDKLNKIAHDNALKQLHRANTRIAEFEDIKKAHLKHIEKLNDKHNDLAQAYAALLTKRVNELKELKALCDNEGSDWLIEEAIERMLKE